MFIVYFSVFCAFLYVCSVDQHVCLRAPNLLVSAGVGPRKPPSLAPRPGNIRKAGLFLFSSIILYWIFLFLIKTLFMIYLHVSLVLSLLEKTMKRPATKHLCFCTGPEV